MKSLFEEMGGTYRQVGDYFIPNLVLPDTGNYQSGKYGRLRHSYLKEHRKILYSNYVMEGTLFEHLAEIDQACNERMAIIVHAMAKQEGVTEALKAADQMEWVRLPAAGLRMSHVWYLLYQQRTVQILSQVCPAGRCGTGSCVHPHTDHQLQTMRQAVSRGWKTGLLFGLLC